MSLAAGKMRLDALTRELLLNWAQTRDSWRDVKSLEFERTYLAELRANVDKTTAVIEQLDKLIAKIRSDCE